MNRGGFAGFIIFAIFGAYLVIQALNIFTFPTAVTNYDKWIYLVSGALLVIGGISFLVRRGFGRY